MSAYFDLNEDSKAEQLRHAEVIRKFEAQKRARSINVPTSVEEIKLKLRELGHPVTLFAEGHADRRERLREVIAHLELNEEELQKLQSYMTQSVSTTEAKPPTTGTATQEQLTKQKEVFYSPAVETLIAIRKDLCAWSFQRAHERLLKTKEIRESESKQIEENRVALSLYLNAKDMTLNASQFADERPLTTVRYNSAGNFLASGALSYTVKLWDSSTLINMGVLRGHSDRITSVAWSPGSTDGGSSAPYLLASSSADGSCNIWDTRAVAASAEENQPRPEDNSNDMDVEESNGESDPSHSHNYNNGNDNADDNYQKPKALVHKLKGHQGVVSSCAFHPKGHLLATSGHDYSWRLWDVETAAELLLQDGHVKECSAIDFHQDGSLVMTGDAGGVALLWDLRSGQCVQPFQGHIKKISGISFNANGFQVATSSLDNTVKIWDLRKKKCGYTLPAHSNIVSDMKFSASGELLLTASFDGTLKIWSSRDLRILRTLSGHSGKVMACDFAPDERHIVSAGYDRTVKLWAHKDEF